MIQVEDFKLIGFRHEYHNTDINFDSFKKGKDWKIILFWGTDAPYEVPLVWIVFNNLTMFKGRIHDKDELKLVYSLVEIPYV